MIGVYRRWMQKRRDDAQEKARHKQAVYNGIMNLYQERGEPPHPAVIERMLGLPHHLREYGTGTFGHELYRIGWHGEDGRRRIREERVKLGLSPE